MFDTTSCQVNVIDFPDYYDEEFIRMIFRDIGTIKQNGIQFKNSQLSGYINLVLTFEYPYQARSAIFWFNNTTSDGHPMRIIPNDPETMDLIKRRENILIITGLEDNISAYELHQMFHGFGVIQTYITSGLNRIGYVQFYKAENAEKAMRTHDGSIVKDCEIRIEKFNPQITGELPDAMTYFSCIED